MAHMSDLFSKSNSWAKDYYEQVLFIDWTIDFIDVFDSLKWTGS